MYKKIIFFANAYDTDLYVKLRALSLSILPTLNNYLFIKYINIILKIFPAER